MKPEASEADRVTYFAETDYRNTRTRFGIKARDRTKHVYTIGKTGMGKSTMLENMAVQDIQNGEGLALIDPHGATADTLLDYIPEHRLEDVLYFAPFDLAHPIAFNVMEDVGEDKRHLVASGLMSAFKKIWVDAWSARMEYILNNTILALLEYPSSTLLSINRMLADKEYRKRVVAQVTDPAVRSFWVDEFASYTERFAAEATPAIQNKVGQFTSNPLIRNIVGQPYSSFDLRTFMDERKILIVNLSKGLVGEANANLLGSMIITKIYLAAMSRADRSREEAARLPNFYLYVDEFQSFANESFANILSEARKYNLNLTIAHQYVEQMSDEVRAAVFGNVGTMIAFRVGAYDAEVFEKEFAPQFAVEDLVNLGKYQIYLKLMVDGVSTAPFSAVTMSPIPKPPLSYRDMVIRTSREKYARRRDVVEEEIVRWHASGSNAIPVAPVAARAPGEGKMGTSGPRRTHLGRPDSQKKQERGALRDTLARVLESRPSFERSSRTSEKETALRMAISLDHLKAVSSGKEKDKGPTVEHLNELKTAIAGAEQKKEVAPAQHVAEPQDSRSSIHVEHTPPSAEKPKEVPEHVLKKLLEMEKK